MRAPSWACATGRTKARRPTLPWTRPGPCCAPVRPFVWNATHLSRQMRGKSVDLCLAYGARVQLVHLEAAKPVLLERNRNRDTTLSNAALLSMLHRWEVPLPTEAHGLQLLASERP